MKDYWLIRAGRNAELWDFWKKDQIISIGWDIGKVSQITEQGLRDKVSNKNFEQKNGYVSGTIMRFIAHKESQEKMKNGDIVIILGPSIILDIAEIGDYYYKENGIEGYSDHSYCRKVKFMNIGPIRFGDLSNKYKQGGKYPIHLVKTLKKYHITEEEFNELNKVIKLIEPIDIFSSKFHYSEKDIQNYIEKNFKLIDKNFSKIKREYKTKVGYVDFLAYDKDNVMYAIEVKIGTANDSAIGQLLGYIDAIKEETNKKVIGILVAEGFIKRVAFTAKSQGIKTIKFSIKLEFQEE